jgi:sec-independent protein translocase protein TatC
MSSKDEKKRDAQAETEPEEDDWDDDDWEELDEEAEQFPRMSFLDHLEELRSRIYKMVVVLFLAVIVCWTFVDPVWNILEGPARQMLANAQEKSLEVTKSAQNLKLEIEALPPLPEDMKDNAQLQEFRRIINRHLKEQSKILEEQIRQLLIAKDSKLMQTAVGEAFFLKVKLALFTGIAVSFPFLFYQIWAFVAPGLYRRERRIAIPFMVFSTLFFAGGLVFGYYVAVPFAGTFLMSFGTEFVQLITIDKYMDFLIMMLLGLGIVFEIPMVIFLLAKLGIATPRWLIKNFRYAVLVIVIVAAVVTPTGDPVNLAIFSIPMILLYCLGIGIAAIWGPKKSRFEADEDEEWEEDEDEEDDDEDDGGDDDDDNNEDNDDDGGGDDDNDAGDDDSGEGESADEVGADEDELKPETPDDPASGESNPEDPYKRFYDKED